jgi:hypothetical protein
MNTMPAFAAIAFLCAAACAPSSGSPSPAPAVVSDPQGMATSDARGRQITISSGGDVSDSLVAAPDAAFKAVVAAYGELGLGTPMLDMSARRVGDPRMTVSRSLKGAPLSRFLSCGEGLMGPRANTDRIMLSIVSQVHPRGTDGSRVETKITAVAVDTSGRGGQAQCSTTGELEELLHQAARAALGS